MKRRPLVALAALTFVVIYGCGPRGSSPSQTHIVGDKARSSDGDAWPEAVALVADGRLHCTGTLVQPRLVVTAAHCLANLGSDIRSLRVYRGPGAAGGRLSAQYAVVRGNSHPESKSGNIWGLADIAYLVVAEEIDQPSITVASAPSDLASMLAPGARATLVGYGTFDNQTRQLGKKHEVEATVRFATAQEVFMGDSHGDACEGDSGGPVFAQDEQGRWKFLAVTSRGPTPCGSDFYPGAFSLLAAHLCWLEQDSGFALGAHGQLACHDASGASALAGGKLANLCADPSLPLPTARTRDLLLAVVKEQGQGSAAGGGATCDDLARFASSAKTLKLRHSFVTDLSLLAFFSALEELDIEDNEIRDLGPLHGLKQLRDLRLGWNDIRDFSPVQGVLGRGGRILGQRLQNSTWHLSRDTVFLKQCLTVQSGGELDPGVASAVAAIKKAACLGSQCSCYTASDNLQIAREINLTPATRLSTLQPLSGLANLQYLKLPVAALRDDLTLGTLENLRSVEGR